MYARSANLGFTLIEIMVVLVISLLLTSMGMVAYGRINRSKQVEVAADNLVSVLRQVQTNSYSAKVDTSGTCTGVFEGMSLQVTEGNNQYINQVRCSSSGVTNVGLVKVVGRGVKFILVDGISRADYLPLGKGLSQAVSFRLVHVADATECRQVDISQTGRINIIKC